MHKFRLLQKRTKRILNVILIFSAVYIFAFIGAEPYITKSLGSSVVFNYIAQALIVISLVFLYVYYSKFGRADKFIEDAEYKISDAGYYITSRQEKDINSYFNELKLDLQNCSFKISNNVISNELEFDLRAYKSNEYFYISVIEELDENDIIAYLDSAIYDLTAVNLKRKGNAVICFLCNSSSEKALSYSKDITSLGRKSQLQIAISICNVKEGKVYFLGNKPSKAQSMIANYVMNCEVPVKEQYVGKEKLPFQYELENRLKDFDIKSFKEGKYN